MDIRQLRRFVTVAEVGSFNKAAELLAVSQPSLARSIQLLEETVGAKLFERGPRGVLLTGAGTGLLPHARIILNECDRAVSAIETLCGKGAESLSIGADTAFCSRYLPEALARFAQTSPTTHVYVVESDFIKAIEQVRDGRLNMALGPQAPFLDLEGVTFEPLMTEGASIFLRREHPLATREGLTLADLVSARWIVPERQLIRNGWEQMFVRAGLPVPEVALSTSSLRLTRSCLLTCIPQVACRLR